MQKKWMIAGGLAVLAAATVHSAPVVAQARSLMQGGERLAHLRSMVADLDLTQAQKLQIKQIIANAAPTVQPLIEQIERNHLAMRAATENGYDTARVRAIADKQGQLVSRLTVEGAKIKSEVFGVLTDEQRRKAERDETFIEQQIAGFRYGDIVAAVLQ